MKSVLISIQPQHIDNICTVIDRVDGKPVYKKSIEVRKTRPQIETPFKCYIYCTLSGCKQFAQDDLLRWGKGKWYEKKGKVIGEFVCDRIEKIEPGFEYYSDGYDIDDDMITETCLTREELMSYGKGKPLYGWHISDLKIYDKPKELGEFLYPCKHQYSKANEGCKGCRYAFKGVTSGEIYCDRTVIAAPQSWCYVEV